MSNGNTVLVGGPFDGATHIWFPLCLDPHKAVLSVYGKGHRFGGSMFQCRRHRYTTRIDSDGIKVVHDGNRRGYPVAQAAPSP